MKGFGYVLILSATHGPVVVAIQVSLLMLRLSRRFRSPIFLGTMALSLIVLILWGGTILNLLPVKNIQSLQTLLQGEQNIGNFNQ